MNSVTDYNRIASAITYLTENVTRQPSLAEVAAHVHLSEFHFQRMFTDWAGVSPKKFLQFLTVQYARQLLLSRKSLSLFEAADEAGLSGTGRLHDLFINIEGMTPGEFKNHGKDLEITYDVGYCQFGSYIVAATARGVCNLYFYDGDSVDAISELKQSWYNASFKHGAHPHHENISAFFKNEIPPGTKISLHLRGTPFQLKVWQALLKIPEGRLTNYGGIAESIGQRSASRAVGSAIGSNQVAFLIPCHRVIRNSAVIGDFRWGTERKRAMIGWEAAHIAGSYTVV